MLLSLWAWFSEYQISVFHILESTVLLVGMRNELLNRTINDIYCRLYSYFKNIDHISFIISFQNESTNAPWLRKILPHKGSRWI